ncbi:hypothetical protein QBC34DRAFT_183313 [Podospora aff. communis PSN243]|uniref:HORMA domain-containing protein n=1 Tax=Podospora aff. communis PSN243 TaxID=3040156 RepID=A0AAV9GB31_9PEZI|nr:hypothetical protein QBC34DRAFT_183313 [Podospora aff. communis PSN243]
MPDAQGSSQRQDPPPVRDVALCKVIFSAVLSQILYSRQSFPPSNFQYVPLCDLLENSFEDLVHSGAPLDQYDPEVTRDQDGAVLLRDDSKDYSLATFLALLTSDIFPLIESEELVKFRISFLRSPRLESDSLLEYYTVVLKYEAEARYSIDVWRASTIKQHVARSKFKLWNLGDYLSRLPPWKGPVYCTLAFHATNRPDDPFIGTWKYDRADFDDAKLQLEQRPHYSFQRIATLVVGPPEKKKKKSSSVLSRPVVEAGKPEGKAPENATSDAPVELAEPEAAELVDSEGEYAQGEDDEGGYDEEGYVEEGYAEEGDAEEGDAEGKEDEIEDTTAVDGEAEEHIGVEGATSGRFVDVDNYDVPSESDVSVYEPKPKRRKTAVKGKVKGSAKTTKRASAKPRGGTKKTVARQQEPSPPTTATSQANRSSAKGTSNAKTGSTTPTTGQVPQSLPVNSRNGPGKQGKLALKTKRKAKQPLQMFSDPASNMTETQDAVRESQGQLQNASPSKQRMDRNIGAAVHKKPKRFHAAAEPSSGQFQMIDGIVHTSDPSESRELSVSGQTPPLDAERLIAEPDNNPTQTNEMVAQEEAQAPRNAKKPALRLNSLIQDVDGIDIESIFADEEAEVRHDTLLGGLSLHFSSSGEDDTNEEDYDDDDDDDDEYEDEEEA